MTTTTTAHALEYADPETARPAPRRSRLALVAAFWCLGSALASYLLMLAGRGNALPQHFLCCKHPEVAVFAFVVVPSIGAAAGLVSLLRIARSRGSLTGWLPAATAVMLGPGLALVGCVLVALVKM